MAGHPLYMTAFTSRFSCLGDTCEDTCCKSWSMQLDDQTYQRYTEDAPELLAAVAQGPTGGRIMRRDPVSDFCVKFEQGLCGIHASSYGSDFLGDACHFYPRITRRLADATTMTAALSCPEAARLALLAEDAFLLSPSTVARLPHHLRDYAPEDMPPQAALEIHGHFLSAALDENCTPSRAMMRIVSVAQSLRALPHNSWPMAVPFYLRSADDRLPPPEDAQADPFNLLHALMGIVVAANAAGRERLRATMADMEAALQVELDWEAMSIRATTHSAQSWEHVRRQWQSCYAEPLAPLLRRWVAAQLSMALFPFAGFGEDVAQRALLMAVRFATVRLALMCACHVAQAVVDEAQQIRIIQSVSRVLDHLADPELSLRIYDEPGWLREARLRALTGDMSR